MGTRHQSTMRPARHPVLLQTMGRDPHSHYRPTPQQPHVQRHASAHQHSGTRTTRSHDPSTTSHSLPTSSMIGEQRGPTKLARSQPSSRTPSSKPSGSRAHNSGNTSSSSTSCNTAKQNTAKQYKRSSTTAPSNPNHPRATGDSTITPSCRPHRNERHQRHERTPSATIIIKKTTT